MSHEKLRQAKLKELREWYEARGIDYDKLVEAELLNSPRE